MNIKSVILWVVSTKLYIYLYMGMRSAVFDDWLKKQMESDKSAVVLHIGCGMDSRVERVGTHGHLWYDIDFPEVICERKRSLARKMYRLYEYKSV